MTIGEAIKTMRIVAGLSQDQLAQECGLSRNSIQRYEAEAIMPRMPQLKKIAAVFHLTVNELMSEEIVNDFSHRNSEYMRELMTKISPMTDKGMSLIQNANLDQQNETAKTTLNREGKSAMINQNNVILKTSEYLNTSTEDEPK
jgi:transcriptional regulator with XRE-family HTH domain